MAAKDTKIEVTEQRTLEEFSGAVLQSLEAVEGALFHQSQKTSCRSTAKSK